EVGNLDWIDCKGDGTGCRARSYRKGLKIKAACIKHTAYQQGPQQEKHRTGWTPRSTCPSGYNAIGVAKVYEDKKWDTIRIWDCNNDGCRLYCMGTGKCEVRTACISAKVIAKARCSLYHRNLITRFEVFGGQRTIADCPSTHNSLGCVCEGIGGGTCSSNVGCTHNFEVGSGGLTRICTQPVGSFKVYLDDEASPSYGDLEAGWVWKERTFSADHSGKLKLKFKGEASSAVDIRVRELTISDTTTQQSSQSF
ncbi:nipblb, partial [Symbiodinium sp. KB8]